MFVFCPDESWRKAFDVVIIKDLSRLLRREENFACESDSVFTLKAVLHVGVTLQLRALVLFLFWFEKGVISFGSKQQFFALVAQSEHNKSAGGW